MNTGTGRVSLARPVRPLGVLLDHRRIGDVQPGRHVLDRRPRNLYRIFQEQPQVADRAHPDPRAQTRVHGPLLRDQIQRSGIQQENPVQVGTGQLADEPAITRNPFSRKKLDRHNNTA